MTDGHDELTRDEIRAREALRSLPAPTADPAFRARLKGDFVRGTIAEAPAPRVLELPRRWPWLGWAAGAAAAAAALVLVPLLNSGPRWQVMGLEGPGPVRVGGREIAADAIAGLPARLRASVWIEVSAGSQLDLVLPGVAVMQITGGTTATLPASPGRWYGRLMESSLERGEVRFSTGPAFEGVRLAVVTREARAEVVGTTFAVVSDSIGSCTCVFEGAVRLVPHGAAGEVIREGTHRYLLRGGAFARAEPLPPMEVMKLGMLRDQADSTLQR
jgi:ferric-dicitrate binding protein FerR (iron transport regulator)